MSSSGIDVGDVFFDSFQAFDNAGLDDGGGQFLDGVESIKGVQFSPVVKVMNGGECPLAGGDGFWDTLQYECRVPVLGNESCSSISLGEFDNTMEAPETQRDGPPETVRGSSNSTSTIASNAAQPLVTNGVALSGGIAAASNEVLKSATKNFKNTNKNDNQDDVNSAIKTSTTSSEQGVANGVISEDDVRGEIQDNAVRQVTQVRTQELRSILQNSNTPAQTQMAAE
jgi:hypothetical protein